MWLSDVEHDWLTDQPRTAALHPTILCCMQLKIDLIVHLFDSQNIFSGRWPLCDWPVWYPEEYLYTSVAFALLLLTYLPCLYSCVILTVSGSLSFNTAIRSCYSHSLFTCCSICNIVVHVCSWNLMLMVPSHLTLLIQYQSSDKLPKTKAGQWTYLSVRSFFTDNFIFCAKFPL